MIIGSSNILYSLSALPFAETGRRPPRYRPLGETQDYSGVKLLKAIEKKIVRRCESLWRRCATPARRMKMGALDRFGRMETDPLPNRGRFSVWQYQPLEENEAARAGAASAELFASI